MHNPDWDEIFGPSHSRVSKAGGLDHAEEVISRSQRISRQLRGVRNRLIRDDALTHARAPDIYPIREHIQEAHIVSRNAEAMLRTVERMLEEKVARRMEEESRVRWPWPDEMFAKVWPIVPLRPTARSKAAFKGKVHGGEEEVTIRSPRRSGRQACELPVTIGGITSRAASATEEARQEVGTGSERHHTSSSSHDNAEISLGPVQGFKHMPQASTKKSSPAASTSSKYSQSTNGARQLSLRSSSSIEAREDTPIAWPWPASIVQAASGRSSNSFSTAHSTSPRTSASSSAMP